jgi:hypothetical protein
VVTTICLTTCSHVFTMVDGMVFICLVEELCISLYFATAASTQLS